MEAQSQNPYDTRRSEAGAPALITAEIEALKFDRRWAR